MLLRIKTVNTHHLLVIISVRTALNSHGIGQNFIAAEKHCSWLSSRLQISLLLTINLQIQSEIQKDFIFELKSSCMTLCTINVKNM